MLYVQFFALWGCISRIDTPCDRCCSSNMICEVYTSCAVLAKFSLVLWKAEACDGVCSSPSPVKLLICTLYGTNIFFFSNRCDCIITNDQKTSAICREYP